MPIRPHSLYEDRESTTTKWVVIFVVLSLLAHVVIVAAIYLITHFLPAPKIKPLAPIPPTLKLSLMPAPAPPPQRTFVTTPKDPNAKPKVVPIESANNANLKTKSQKARAPDSIMPDVVGKRLAPSLNNTPKLTLPKPEISVAPPAPKQPAPQKTTPPQPTPQKASSTPRPPQPAPKPHPPTPPLKPVAQVDPITGLPVIAPTMAPPNEASQQPAPPPLPAEAADSHGSVGMNGDNSPAAMATVLGRYKQKIYLAVGSRWYAKVDSIFQTQGVGMVHVQFTIHADGTVETKVLDGGDSSMQTLLSISINSIREAAPFDKFDDYPGLRDEIIKEQGGDGSTYTSDFTFSIYGR
jgi:hypothetical protein